ncbi:hypothetical protein C943_03189 [Mariniradius saccharolyticus AK6]|uniref:Clp protease ClpB n=1 Tax=Mariniradius saccharolyticus AK6 TaxID=1239962 RepID=M7Y2B1_9BACT|nr:hypothetical protein [Mariniradius saccharolyticus]EMS34867.1 hypothetical protein C943_03189 [Mariniradius saccharolyticus AK6]
MRKILLVCLAFLLVSESFAQEKLKKLVEERESLHQAWKVSESKKTGIFGNRTKKDMVETHGWMERIIDKDNLIMEELKLLRDIEKTEITYEKNDYKFISQKQEREIATLKKVLAEKDLEMQEKQKSTRTYEWTTLIFFVSTLLLGFAYSRKRRS